jgi:hypothetical protein
MVIIGFSCEEEYDHHCQAEADAEAEAQYHEEIAKGEAIINAMKFLVNEGVEPNHYKSFYESNKKSELREDDE